MPRVEQQHWAAGLALGIVGLLSGTALAGGAYGPAPHGCAPQYQVVQKTILVPQMVPQRRVITTTEYRTEIQQREVVVHRPVAEKQMVVETYTELVPQKQMRVQTVHTRRPVWEEVEQQYTAMVPHQELRQGVRHVCRRVPVQEMRTVCRDEGYWDTITCEVPCYGCCSKCGGCGGCGSHCHTVTRRVWRPNPVKYQVPVQVWKTEMVEQPFEYMATVYKPEVRVRRVPVCRYVVETHQREVPCTVFVPVKRQRERPVVRYRMVAERQIQNVPVCVPVPVQRETTVMVCQMVPKVVTCRVPLSPSAPQK